VGFWLGSPWVLYLGFNWATYVYSLVYLEALGAFFDIYITYQKKKKKEFIRHALTVIASHPKDKEIC
jgi:uncharacterized membrane-anchored protein YitT (DUF2179 family)